MRLSPGLPTRSQWTGCCLAFPRTGKRVEVAPVVVVQFDGDKMAHEHLYWNQASVLVQLGLLQPEGLPVVDADGDLMAGAI